MTTPVTGSTVESRRAALALFQGQVPCIFRLHEPPCPGTAGWLSWFVHEENTAVCDLSEPWPVCDEHKRIITMISDPFWRTWHQLAPIPCGQCKTPLRLERFEPLDGGHG